MRILKIFATNSQSTNIMADQQYSDDQLLQLLKDAEGRLRGVKKTQETTAQSLVSLQDRYEASWEEIGSLTNLLYSISKGSSPNQITSYISSTSKIAQVDAAHLVTEEQRKLANEARVVVDPVSVKANAAKVSLFTYIFQISSMRKIFQSTWRRIWPRLGSRPAIMMFLFS